MADPRRKPTKNKANTTNVRKAIINHIWLVVSSPLKNMKVSWDDYSKYVEKKMFQTTNQYSKIH
jgi:hypothetical protein